MKYAFAICLLVCSMTSYVEAQSSKQIKLDRRTDSKYKDSGYSFRYQTLNEKTHRNYVDIVYEAGVMRINNHNRLRNQIVDLGFREGLSKAEKFDLEDVTWTSEMLQPNEGHTYAMQINADNNQMIVVFHVSKVAEDKLEFKWQQIDGPKKWPIDLRGRGFAGTSGMLATRSVSRSKAGRGR